MVDKIRAWLRVLFPVVITIISICLIVILWWDGWPTDTADLRIKFLGTLAIISQLTLTLWYFMNKFASIKAGRDGFEINGGGNEPNS